MIRRGLLAAALGAALLACGVKAPPRPPERAAAHEPSTTTTTVKQAP
jgi:hypothetical protein